MSEGGEQELIYFEMGIIFGCQRIHQLANLEKSSDIGELSFAQVMTIEQLDACENETSIFLKNLKFNVREEIELTPSFGFDWADTASIDRDFAIFLGVDSEETVTILDYGSIDDDTREFLIFHLAIIISWSESSVKIFGALEPSVIVVLISFVPGCFWIKSL